LSVSQDQVRVDDLHILVKLSSLSPRPPCTVVVYLYVPQRSPGGYEGHGASPSEQLTKYNRVGAVAAREGNGGVVWMDGWREWD